jgi:2-amino-4-hydroxy-6-hydroxymethyldihydropteridine diphosphokinase/dihydropteroate synthase
VSPIYESDALLPEGASPDWNAPYLNLALLGSTETEPIELLRWIKAQEVALGRKSGPRWSPREIDIDLIAIEGVRLETPTVTLPHRETTSRPFVLLPVADLVPQWDLGGASTGARSAAELARQWRGDPDQVPFRTRPTPLSLTELVGIVNLTEDSFSDGGRWLDPDRAIERATDLAKAGATVIDLGAESTRPGAKPISAAEEWRRLEPVLGELVARRSSAGPLLSVDTRHAATAARAAEAGANWLNDVTGFQDPAMIEVASRFDGDLVVMHSLVVPPVSGVTLPLDGDPLAFLLEWGRDRLATLSSRGVAVDRIILDPGIGFGKTAGQTIGIVGRIGELRELGARILVGHSRKSFLKTLFARSETDPCWNVADREHETFGMTVELARAAVDFIRVHDVVGNARVLRASAQTRGAIRWRPTEIP